MAEKVNITNIDTRETIQALFNPKEYSISKSTNWTDYNQKGRDMPESHFTTGQRRELKMELFFDTYADKKNVKDYVKKIERLMLIDVEKHRPPLVLVHWGKNALNFQCVLEHMEQRYTMFIEDGTPVRAIVNVTFKEIDPNQNGALVSEGEKQSPDHTKVRVIKAGDTLQSLSAFEYEDASLWKILAEHNDIEDPLNIPAGTIIEIPPL